jgi:hypothetical protein
MQRARPAEQEWQRDKADLRRSASPANSSAKGFYAFLSTLTFGGAWEHGSSNRMTQSLS